MRLHGFILFKIPHMLHSKVWGFLQRYKTQGFTAEINAMKDEHRIAVFQSGSYYYVEKKPSATTELTFSPCKSEQD